MLKADDRCCGVAIDIPLTQDELEGRDDHAANIWRLVVDMCTSKARVILPRRYSNSQSAHEMSRHRSSSLQSTFRTQICVIASEVDPQSFTSIQKANCLVFDRNKMPSSKQTVTNKLLKLLGRRTKGSEGLKSPRSFEKSDRSRSPTSLSVEQTNSDSDSLAIYASNDPSAWKKVQAYVQKNDKYSVDQNNGRFAKPAISPLSLSQSQMKTSTLIYEPNSKLETNLQKGQRRYSEDFSKSLNENLISGGELQPSPLNRHDVIQSSAYLASSIFPPTDVKSQRSEIVSNLFSLNGKEDIDEEFDLEVIGQQVIKRQDKGDLSDRTTVPFIKSFKSVLKRIRPRRPNKSSRIRVECSVEEPSLTVSRSSSIDVGQTELIND